MSKPEGLRMARAGGIWIVKGAYGEPDTIRGVFTVKHECVKWLRKQAEPRSYIVDRYQDGNPEAGHVRVHLGELFGERNLCIHHTDSGTE